MQEDLGREKQVVGKGMKKPSCVGMLTVDQGHLPPPRYPRLTTMQAALKVPIAAKRKSMHVP